jgi:hypothetical protein
MMNATETETRKTDFRLIRLCALVLLCALLPSIVVADDPQYPCEGDCEEAAGCVTSPGNWCVYISGGQSYTKFNYHHGDTLTHPQYWSCCPASQDKVCSFGDENKTGWEEKRMCS